MGRGSRLSLSVSNPLRWALTGYGTGEPFVPLPVKPASLGFDRVWDGTAFLISRSCRQRPHWGALMRCHSGERLFLLLSFWGASLPPAVILGSVSSPAVILRSVSSPAVILRSVSSSCCHSGERLSPRCHSGERLFPPAVILRSVSSSCCHSEERLFLLLSF